MKRLLITTIGSLLLTTTAFADDFKAGVLDVEKVMQSSPQVAAFNQDLSKQFKPRNDKLVADQKTFQADVDKLNRDGTVMTEKDRQALQSKIMKERDELRKQSESFQQDLNNAQNQMMGKFMATLKQTVGNYAESNHYDLVVLKQATGYYNPKFDITDAILRNMPKK